MSRIFDEELLPLFQTMIRNQCVNTGDRDSGHEDRSVATLQNYFHGKGLKTEVFHAVPGRGNLLVRVPGTDPAAPSLMLMGHIDVVPAQAEDWTHDPFGGEIHEGQVWGRGAVDMLCWTACQAVGFAEALAQVPGGRFPGTLMFLALADEEASGRYGAQFLTQNHWDQVACDYMVTELGGFFIPTNQGPAAFINLGEKGVAWLRIRTRGTPGHGSMPYRTDNALLKIAEAARKLSQWSDSLHPHGIYRRMAQTMGGSAAEKFRLSTGWGEKGALRNLFRRDVGMARFLHTAGRTTLSPNWVQAGQKVNIVADRGELLVDIRFLPGRDQEALLSLVKRILGPRLTGELTFEWVDFFPPNLSDEKTPLMEATRAIFREAHPGAELAPLFIGGVTDGRFWRQRGTTVYGFTLFDQDMTMDAYGRRIHGVDERISLGSLARSLEYFTRLPGEFYRRTS